VCTREHVLLEQTMETVFHFYISPRAEDAWRLPSLAIEDAHMSNMQLDDETA